MNKELNQLNFNKILVLETDIDNYDFNEYLKNDKHLIKGFCTLCEDTDCNICPGDSSFKLQTISHGATTYDILLATGQDKINLIDWHKDGVLFLMENPSNDYGFYEEKAFNGYNKKPTNQWYWVHDKQEMFLYPSNFKGRRYGELFNSIIFTFKLQNAYLTNLVKCGMNNDVGFMGIENYNRKCIDTCFENILSKEINIVNPKVVFCFGKKVSEHLWDLFPGSETPFTLVELPHPASGRNGLKDEFFRHLYFTRILEGLYKSGVYTLEQAEKKFGEFVNTKVSNVPASFCVPSITTSL